MAKKSNTKSLTAAAATASNPLPYSTMTTTALSSNSNWGSYISPSVTYTPPTEEQIASVKFQELMPMIDGLLKEAYQEGFKEGLREGMEEVEKQLSEILTADIIKEAQDRNSSLLKASTV